MSTTSEPQTGIRSEQALWGGIAFSLVFTALIAWAGQWIDHVGFLPDAGPSWYYWKLPVPTLWTRLSAWGLYVLHQVAVWGLIYYAKTRVNRYTTGLHRVNLIALGVNALFIVLHFAQTHLFYDGLAQDVSIWSSQGSVVLMLVLILLMENPRRGLFWGKPVPLPQSSVTFVRKYHGYIFAWGLVYTFWYHPMEGTQGHLLGFLYIFLLLLQGSLFFTRVHTNRWWMVVQEATVAIHGTLVALMQGNNIWPMFCFGFSGIFVLTQMHGLKLPEWGKWTILAVYAGGVAVTYNFLGWGRLNEIVRIPLIEYLLVFVFAGLIAAGLWVARRFQRPAKSAD